MDTRKQKPGVKRSVGRPPTAKRRKAQADRIKSERKILQEMGYKVMNVVVPAHSGPINLAMSKLNRAKSLAAYARANGEVEEAKKRELKVAEAEIDLQAAQKETQQLLQDRRREGARQVSQSLAGQSHMITNLGSF